MIELRNAYKTYNTNGNDKNVLENVNLRVERGEFIILFGRSGCGKTTLLNIIGLIDNLTSGEYLVEGINAEILSRKEAAKYRNALFGYIFQSFYLLPDLSAGENIQLPMRYKGMPRDEQKERTKILLEQVGMAGRDKEFPNRMSGGEQQRIAIARALANKPPYLLADEPTGNLDTTNRDHIVHLLSQINKEQGSTIVMVTHDRELLKYADRVVEM
ncbi:MAG: ABC transporter ATP-binding protein [Aeriscardovia sp.]|nr:ABC transporter ATP-binding protein [Aeriscardovia sp.]